MGQSDGCEWYYYECNGLVVDWYVSYYFIYRISIFVVSPSSHDDAYTWLIGSISSSCSILGFHRDTPSTEQFPSTDDSHYILYTLCLSSCMPCQNCLYRPRIRTLPSSSNGRTRNDPISIPSLQHMPHLQTRTMSPLPYLRPMYLWYGPPLSMDE